jgi:hypothetical protein
MMKLLINVIIGVEMWGHKDHPNRGVINGVEMWGHKDHPNRGVINGVEMWGHKDHQNSQKKFLKKCHFCSKMGVFVVFRHFFFPKSAKKVYFS